MTRPLAAVLCGCLAACSQGPASDLDDFLNQTQVVDAGTSSDAGEPDASVPDAGELDGGAPDASVPDAGLDAGLRVGPALYLLRLDAGAFPPTGAHPNVIVYIPRNFDPKPPLDVVVWLHGFNNCIENVIRDAGGSCDPDAGTPVRGAYQLVAQLEASNKNAVLLAPELGFDAASGNPGALANQGGFFDLLDETLVRIRPTVGPLNVADVGKVIVASHSGGYQAAASIVSAGGVPLREIWLFDSLYGYTATFENWVYSDLVSIDSGQRRFGTVYTFTGGTDANSQAMATDVAMRVDAGSIHDDRTTSTWTLAEYHYGALFKQSALSHDDVPRYYFGKFLQTSTLRDR